MGQRIDLASKDKGDNSMCVKRSRTERVVGRGCARSACHGESWICLKPSSQTVLTSPTGRTRGNGVDPYCRFSRGRAVRSGDHALTCVVRQENDRATYNTLERPSMTYHGTVYRARAPRRRSTHSTQRAGKPRTGGRGAGEGPEASRCTKCAKAATGRGPNWRAVCRENGPHGSAGGGRKRASNGTSPRRLPNC